MLQGMRPRVAWRSASTAGPDVRSHRQCWMKTEYAIGPIGTVTALVFGYLRLADLQIPKQNGSTAILGRKHLG